MGWFARTMLGVIPRLPGALMRGTFKGVLQQLTHVDNVRFGLFTGSFLAVVNTVLLQLRRSVPPRGAAVMPPLYLTQPSWYYYRGAIAGGAAGGCIQLLPYDMQKNVTIFIFVRSFEMAVRMLHNRSLLPTIPHSDSALLMTCSSHLMWAWIFQQDLLPPDYRGFVNRFGRKSTAQLAFVGYYLSNGTKNGPGAKALVANVNKNFAKRKLPPLDLGPSRNLGPDVFCRTLHPSTPSCTKHFISYWFAGLRPALSLYGPVYGMPLVLFNFRRLLARPVQSLKDVFFNVCRSSVFLSSYTSFGWGVACLAHLVFRFLGHKSVRTSKLNPTVFSILAGGFACGGCIFMEKRSRRIELALYFLLQSVHTLTRTRTMHKLHRSTPFLHTHTTTLVSMVCSASVVHCYLEHDDMLRRVYLSLMKRLFDH
jgi:hypothetical protein